ncbi:6634_t:CDS:2 [Funneliformis caledonium]|uniref:6634_t:CDS:1 n=1 Tax=Funneliformis caledonium TaxID=1117310 RepID=A0A9N8WF37_9GLOM|nr:6634_t:CDS:2 [Funneliformis caledonium]
METIPVENIYKGFIFDSLKEDGFIRLSPFIIAKRALAGTAISAIVASVAVAGIALMPLAIVVIGMEALGTSILAGMTAARAFSGETREGLEKLENFVSVINENYSDLHPKVIFDMKYQLLDSKENEKLKSFLKGFDLARKVANKSIKHFEFSVNIVDERCLKGSNFLYNHLADTYGNEHVTLEQRNYFLKENNIFISRGINDIILLL